MKTTLLSSATANLILAAIPINPLALVNLGLGFAFLAVLGGMVAWKVSNKVCKRLDS